MRAPDPKKRILGSPTLRKGDFKNPSLYILSELGPLSKQKNYFGQECLSPFIDNSFWNQRFKACFQEMTGLIKPVIFVPAPILPKSFFSPAISRPGPSK